MYCGKCGAKNNDDDLFCTKCGNQLNNNNTNNDNNTVKNDIIPESKKIDEPQKEKICKTISTAWLDFISYVWGVFGVLYILIGFIDLFNGNTSDFFYSLIYIISGVIYISALYFIHSRSKSGYYFFIYIFTIASINTLFNGIMDQCDNDYLISYTIGSIIGILLIYIPNILYIRKRKFIFLNEEEAYYGENIFYFVLFLSLFISCAMFIFNMNNI